MTENNLSLGAAGESVPLPPNYKDSSKFFLLPSSKDVEIPFALVPLSILSPNGRNLVEQFEQSAGNFLGGGVIKSRQLEAKAKEKEHCLMVYAQMRAYISSLPAQEVIKRSVEWTSEWIALEYALLISITMYGLIVPIPWDAIEKIEKSKKRFLSSDTKLSLHYRNKKGTLELAEIEANARGMESLISIARACKVSC